MSSMCVDSVDSQGGTDSIKLNEMSNVLSDVNEGMPSGMVVKLL